MVKGLETFRKAMQPYKEHFVIIGGTACECLRDYAGTDRCIP